MFGYCVRVSFEEDWFFDLVASLMQDRGVGRCEANSGGTLSKQPSVWLYASCVSSHAGTKVYMW